LDRDPRFATNAARCENQAMLKRLLEVVTLDRSVAEWTALLDDAGLPTAKVQTMAQVLRDPQLLARNMVLPVDPQGDGPGFVAAGNPIKMSTLTDPTHRAAAPSLDGDRAAVLAWLEGARNPA
jgi:CoA:oxalate CoA-transferase